MRQGIHLGRRRPQKGNGPLAIFALVVLVASAVHLSWYLDERRDFETHRASLETLVGEQALHEELDRALADEASLDVLRRLAAVSRSGVVTFVSPSAVLTMLAKRVPQGARLVGLSLTTSEPSPSLSLEAITERSELVSELQEQIAGASFVENTEILEERLLSDGGLEIRLRVDLNLKEGASR